MLLHPQFCLVSLQNLGVAGLCTVTSLLYFLKDKYDSSYCAPRSNDANSKLLFEVNISFLFKKKKSSFKTTLNWLHFNIWKILLDLLESEPSSGRSRNRRKSVNSHIVNTQTHLCRVRVTVLVAMFDALLLRGHILYFHGCKEPDLTSEREDYLLAPSIYSNSRSGNLFRHLSFCFFILGCSVFNKSASPVCRFWVARMVTQLLPPRRGPYERTIEKWTSDPGLFYFIFIKLSYFLFLTTDVILTWM